MLRIVAIVILLLFISGCCVVDTFMYDPTEDELIERELDRKAHPAFSFGYSC